MAGPLGAACAVLKKLGDDLSKQEALIRARDRKARPSLMRGEGLDAHDQVWFKGWKANFDSLLRHEALERGLRVLPPTVKAPLVKLWGQLQVAERNMAGAFNKLTRAPASAKPTAYSPKPAGSPVRSPSSAVPSPAKPVIAPRPQTNPNAPMTLTDATTLEATAMVMSRRYNRPQSDLSKALADTVKERGPKVGFAAAMMEAEQRLVWRLDRGLM